MWHLFAVAISFECSVHPKVWVPSASAPSPCPLIVQILHLLNYFWWHKVRFPLASGALVSCAFVQYYLFSFSCHSAQVVFFSVDCGGVPYYYHALVHQQLARNQDANTGPSKASFHQWCVCLLVLCESWWCLHCGPHPSFFFLVQKSSSFRPSLGHAQHGDMASNPKYTQLSTSASLSACEGQCLTENVVAWLQKTFW